MAGKKPSRPGYVPLRKKLEKTTGTTFKEAAGIVRNAKRMIANGNTTGAQNMLQQKLAGGPSAGMKRTDKSVASAKARSAKAVARLTGISSGTASRGKKPVISPVPKPPSKDRMPSLKKVPKGYGTKKGGNPPMRKG